MNELVIGVENVDVVDSFIVCNGIVVSFVIIANVDISAAIVIGATVDEGDVCKLVIFLAVSYLGPKEVKCTSIFLEVSNTKCVTVVSLIDFPGVAVAIVSVVIHVDPVSSVEYDVFAVTVVVVLAVLVDFAVVVVILIVAVAVLFVVADVIFTTVDVAIDVAVDIFLAVSKPTLGKV